MFKSKKGPFDQGLVVGQGRHWARPSLGKAVVAQRNWGGVTSGIAKLLDRYGDATSHVLTTVRTDEG